MNIMVFDVPAVSGGALSVLEDFYNEVKMNGDKKINWFFVVSSPIFEETENIKVLRFPWVKKNWGLRLYFDYIFASKLVKRYKIDSIFSLQNLVIPFTSVSQTIYMHQSLPFSGYKFKFKENKRIWIYQNVIGKSIIRSLKVAEKVIIQTEWLKKACIESSNTAEEKYFVVPPKLSINLEDYKRDNKEIDFNNLFYPAGGEVYKNHKIIIEAIKELSSQGIHNIKVSFTLRGDENLHIKEIYEEVKKNDLPINFIGKISREEVYDYLSTSVLLFPSYIESFGMPLLEARTLNSMIITSDQSFSREILNGYQNAYYFNHEDKYTLVDILKKISSSNFTYFERGEESFRNLDSKNLTITKVILNNH